MVEFGHSGSLEIPRHEQPRRAPLRLVHSAPAEERLLELAARYQELHGNDLTQVDALARAGRAFLVVLVASLLAWLLLGLAVYQLYAALAG
jgi:hypothetical protein